jgi:hypothetical protein
MRRPTPSKNAGLLGAAALIMTLGTGCAARTVDFEVTRPAMINLQPTGNTMSVGTIEANGQPEAAADVAAELRGRIAHSLNPSVRLQPDGAAVEVDGAIQQDGFTSRTETVSQTCTKTVDDGVDSNGVSQSHQESYDCSYTQEVVTGQSRIRFSVRAGGGDHRGLFTQVYVRSGEVTNPSSADVARLMHGLRAATVEQFAKVILPWKDRVSERFKDCDGDDRCKKGLERVKASDLPGAEALFTQVLAGYDAGWSVPDKQAKRIGEAFYDRAVTRAHQRRYADAIADLLRAIALQPKRAKWPQEVAVVQALEKDEQALRAQGAMP